MSRLFKTILSGLILATLLVISGCQPVTKDHYKNHEPADIYQQGQKFLHKGDYSDAITAFQALNSQYPFNNYSKRGNLGLIYAYFQKSEPAMSLATASRFIRLYPTDKNVVYAYYMMGVINFNNGRGFLERRFPYDMSEHNSDNYQAAYKSFKHIVDNYPDSPYATDARHRMIYLVNVMARYQVEIGQFYYQKNSYVAAAKRGMQVLLHYPQSPEVEPALSLMMMSYHKLGLNKLAYKTASMLNLNFPNNKKASEYLNMHSKPDNYETISNGQTSADKLDQAETKLAHTKRQKSTEPGAAMPPAPANS